MPQAEAVVACGKYATAFSRSVLETSLPDEPPLTLLPYRGVPLHAHGQRTDAVLETQHLRGTAGAGGDGV